MPNTNSDSMLDMNALFCWGRNMDRLCVTSQGQKLLVHYDESYIKDCSGPGDDVEWGREIGRRGGRGRATTRGQAATGDHTAARDRAVTSEFGRGSTTSISSWTDDYDIDDGFRRHHHHHYYHWGRVCWPTIGRETLKVRNLRCGMQ